MNIGLHAAMLERRYPHPPDAVAQAAALGTDSYEIDIGIGRPGEPWAARFEAFRQLVPALLETAERTGVSLASLCLGTLWQTSLASPDPDERAQGVGVIKDVCSVARSLGVSALAAACRSTGRRRTGGSAGERCTEFARVFSGG